MSRTYYTTFYPEEDTIGSKGSAAFLAYTAKLTVYKRSLTTPTAPSGGSYNFDGGVLTPPSGWTVDITEGSNPVWESTTNVSTFVRNDVVTTLTWSTPVEILRSGTVGISPISVSINRPFLIIPADSNGENPVLTNTGPEIRVFEGVTPVVFNGTGTNGVGGNSGGGDGTSTWRIASAVATGVTPGAITDSGNYATIGNITGITADIASVVYTIVGLNSVDDEFTMTVTQSFNRFKGAVIDTTPPGQVAGLTLTTSTETLAGGSVQVKLKATWTANTEPDISYYEPEIKLTSGGDATYIGYQTATNSYEWVVTAGTSYTVRVRAADKSDNKGVYSTAVAITSGTDSVAPGIPTALTAIATFKNIFLSWTNTNGATDTDLRAVEIWEATTNSSGSANKIATVNAVKGAPGAFTRSGITNGTTYYYFLKSVDTSNNTSAFTTTNSVVTNQTSVTVAIDGVFTLTGNSTAVSLGNVVTITGTLGGTGTISGYTTGTNYVVSATNGSTTATLVAADGTALTTTAGTLTGLTFTVVKSAAIPAAVGTSDIIAGSITADRIRASTLTGDRFNTTTSLPGTITIGATGVSIGTVQSDAANPATKINAGTTTIDPGKILISGSTTLSNWRNGTDTTKIEGGSIAANTISANKVEIGSRGLDITGLQFQAQLGGVTNRVDWTAGTIVYTNDAGSIVTQAVSAGNATWSSGVLYIYWTKGGGVLAANTATGTAYGADKIVLATYAGGVNLVVNYGRTIIDGSQITAATIHGDRIIANTVDADKIDSRGLSIKDASGNIILAAGSPLDYTNVGGTKPPSNATNGATFGTNISGQITSGNVSTFIANAAIGSAQIGSLALVGTSNFSVRTSATSTVSRIEMDSQVIKIFEGANLRIKIGNLAA